MKFPEIFRKEESKPVEPAYTKDHPLIKKVRRNLMAVKIEAGATAVGYATYIINSRIHPNPESDFLLFTGLAIGGVIASWRNYRNFREGRSEIDALRSAYHPSL